MTSDGNRVNKLKIYMVSSRGGQASGKGWKQAESFKWISFLFFIFANVKCCLFLVKSFSSAVWRYFLGTGHIHSEKKRDFREGGSINISACEWNLHLLPLYDIKNWQHFYGWTKILTQSDFPFNVNCCMKVTLLTF